MRTIRHDRIQASVSKKLTERGGFAMQSQLQEHRWFSGMLIALSLGLPLLTACDTSAHLSTPTAPSGSSSSASSSVSVAITPSTATTTEGGYSISTSALASRLTDGTVLIAGGELTGGNGSANAELFVPSSNTIEYAGQMTVGRESQTAIALPDDTVLITGGYTFWTYPNPQPVSTAEIYKPQ
jgi:hypothetical protein